MFFLMPDAEELRTMLSIYTEYYEEGFSAFEDDKVHTIAALGVGYQAARTLHWLIDILESPSYEGATREEIAKDLRRSLEELQKEHRDRKHILGQDLWETEE